MKDDPVICNAKIDCFSSEASDIKKKDRTYEAVKEAVLKSGRFSCFEASDDPYTFMNILKDPELETWDMGTTRGQALERRRYRQ